MEKQMIIDKILEIYKTEAPNGRYDLIPLFQDNNIFSNIINILSEPYLNKVDYVVSPEALGWILGVGIARKLEVGFVPNPESKILTNVYIDYTKINKTLEIKDNIIDLFKNHLNQPVIVYEATNLLYLNTVHLKYLLY